MWNMWIDDDDEKNEWWILLNTIKLLYLRKNMMPLYYSVELVFKAQQIRKKSRQIAIIMMYATAISV